MPFPEGYKSPGRPPGSKNIKTYVRAALVLAEADRHPILELIKLADESKDVQFKRDMWLTILSYAEVPQRDPVPFVSSTPEESAAKVNALFAEAAARATPIDPTPPPTKP
jgi:hypothetical protein